ncbi:3-ketodihydrosphingosine reductase-like [Dreissena polymorpha]|uniref:3-dehydrosphinganine reductase n=1 Tax=Dreissena polymorpha TaxID=45954 RepID=A0A9D4IFK7_DREPO|nr:3-ketodihydrosphingosine reductase-like [Dreissena polymorpha]KAH3771574.1 hypothetical protein DPMN_172899 [Dreissena polymorpha]
MLLIVTVSLILFIIALFLSKRLSPKYVKIDGKHVVITGGSSGIGKSLAIQAAQLGANVSILARDKVKLETAKTEIQGYLQSGRKVHCESCDLSGDFENVRTVIQEAESRLGPVFMLVNSAGSSVSRSFVDLKASDFKNMMEMNYYSAINATKAAIPSMVEQQCGRIVFLSSQAGQIGLFGFSAYSGAKFALRGMAEALQMEMTPHNIRVTVSFPPDTDTPGFHSELKSGKPKETIMISETAGLFKAEDVAKTILSDSLKGKFLSYVGLDGWMLATMTSGMSAATSALEVVTQFFLLGLLRVIGLFYLSSFDRIVLQCKKERDAEKPKSS